MWLQAKRSIVCPNAGFFRQLEQVRERSRSRCLTEFLSMRLQWEIKNHGASTLRRLPAFANLVEEELPRKQPKKLPAIVEKTDTTCACPQKLSNCVVC